MPGTIRIQASSANPLVVNFTRQNGTAASCYSDYGMSAAVSLPATISADTSFYFPAPETFIVSVKADGSEIASSSGTTLTQFLPEGRVLVIAPSIDLVERTGYEKGTYRPVWQVAPRRMRMLFLGDSLTVNNVTEASRLWGDNWITYGSALSGGLVLPAHDAGVQGDTTAMMLARFGTDVAAKVADFDAVTILAGTNDSLNGVAWATTKANLISLIAQVQALNKAVFVGTLPPNNSTGFHGAINRCNLWIKRYCALNGIPVIDFHDALVDRTTGSYLSGYFADATHPNLRGWRAMGQKFAAVVQNPYLMPTPYLSPADDDPINLLAHPLFLGGTSGASPNVVPTGWTGATNGTGYTDSVAAQGSWPGLAWKSVKTTSDSHTLMDQLTVNTLVAGHVFAYAMRAATTTFEGNNGIVTIRSWVQPTNITPADIANFNLKADLADTILYQEATLPTGGNQIRTQAIISGVGQNSATLAVGQVTLLDLTALDVL